MYGRTDIGDKQHHDEAQRDSVDRSNRRTGRCDSSAFFREKGDRRRRRQPPALVDETADIRKAAEDIVNGCTFDNNLPCIAEKEIVAVETVADELLHYMVTSRDVILLPKKNRML